MPLFGRRRRVPELLEVLLAAAVTHWPVMPAEERAALTKLTSFLLTRKRWEASAGFALTDEIRVTIAANAALLGLGHGIDVFHRVSGIIVHPAEIVLRGDHVGAIPGTVDSGAKVIAGEAHHGFGPMLISWTDVRRDLRHPLAGQNVVVHEFAHKFDMLDGVMNGRPPLFLADERSEWDTVLMKEYAALTAAQRGDRRSVTPPLLRAYALTNEAEFFAVASELFFTRPVAMRERYPALYTTVAHGYSVDPASWYPSEGP